MSSQGGGGLVVVVVGGSGRKLCPWSVTLIHNPHF